MKATNEIKIEFKDIKKLQHLYIDIFSEEDEDYPDHRVINNKERAVQRILDKITDKKFNQIEIWKVIQIKSWDTADNTFKPICDRLRKLGMRLLIIIRRNKTMLSDEEKQAIEHLTKKMKYYKDNPLGTYVWLTLDEHYVRIILNLIEKQSKEIEELKASHITTKNKATNTEKAKIFDAIENSIDTYIEKSKPYWEQIMTKDEMTIEEALTIIDDMYQDRYKIMSQKTEKETIVDLSKMDYIKFTNLEWASVRVLREVQSLNYKFKKLEDKIKATIEELENQKRQWIEDRDNKHKDSEIIYAIEVLQSLIENSFEKCDKTYKKLLEKCERKD